LYTLQENGNTTFPKLNYGWRRGAKNQSKKESHMPTTMKNNRVKYNSQPW
jgi:hypothetical protein